MNLLYTLTAYPPSTGGAQLYQHMLATQFNRRYQVQVVCQWDENRNDWLTGTTVAAPNEGKTYTMDGVAVYRLGFSAGEKVRLIPYVLSYYPAMSWAVAHLADHLVAKLHPFAQHADLVHNVRIGREPLSYASLQIARARDVPFVFTPVHHPRWTGWPYHVYTALYKAADAVIALTSAEKQTLVELGVAEDNIYVTGMGPVLADSARPDRFIAQHQIDGPIVLFVGQHFPYKGYRQVLQAAPYVWKKVANAHFVFIGPAVGKSEDIFASLVDERVHRLGHVSLQEKTDALAACSLLCLPSTQESFGGVYTEAWSFGKPVIGCNIPAVAEVISDQKDGYLVEQEPAQIAERICHLLLHSTEAQVMGANGRCKVETCYTWQRLSELTEQAYQRVRG